MAGVDRGRMPRPRRLRNWIRGLWPDHNLLRRGSDRAEAGLIALLLVVFLALAPLTALLAGRWAAAVGARAQQAERADRYQVTAVLLETSPSGAYGWAYSRAEARWTGPGGGRHTGDIAAPPGAARGTTVRIWVDRSGAAVTAPLKPAQVTSQAQLAEVVAPLGLALMLLAAGALARRLLERRRLAAWEADWRATGPQWTHQR